MSIVGIVGGALNPVVHSGTAQAATSDVLTLAADANVTADFYKWFRVRIVAGTGAGQERGILGSRKNELAYSMQFDNAAWLKSRSTIAPNVALAPDGTVTADKFAVSSAVGSSYCYRFQLAMEAGVSYGISIYAQAGELSGFVLRDFTVTGQTQTFDVSTGALSGVESGEWSATTITDAEGGWYRCVGELAAASSGGRNVGFVSLLPDSNSEGQGLLVWGAQMVIGADPGFFVPTLDGGAVGIQVDAAWGITPDATSSYEIYIPGLATATGALAQPARPAGIIGGAMPAMHSGIAQGAYFNSLTLAADANGADDHYKWQRVRITGGPGAGQERVILAIRSNLVPSSEDITPWVNSGVTVTSDVTTSPRGDQTADLLMATSGAANRHTRYRVVDVPDLAADAGWTVYGQHATGAVYLTVYMANGGFQQPHRCGRSFDLQTGGMNTSGANTAGNGELIASNIEDAGGGWWQCSITGNLHVDGAGSIAFCAAITDNFAAPGGNIGASWVGDDVSGIYLWGGHANLGSAPEFYAPTQSAAAVGIWVDRPWLVLPDASSAYEIYLPGASAVGIVG